MSPYYLIADLSVFMPTKGLIETRAKPWQSPVSVTTDISIPVSSDPIIESIAEDDSGKEYRRTAQWFNYCLLDFQGFLFHASSIIFRGKAYCFCGSSGTGKSTHTQLWQKVFGKDQVAILNDDSPALRMLNGIWYVYGTPWSGKSNLTINARAPLGGIFMLQQAPVNVLNPEVKRGFKILFLSNCICGVLPAWKRLKSLDLLDDLIRNVPIWGLACCPDEEAVRLAYRAIMEKENVAE